MENPETPHPQNQTLGDKRRAQLFEEFEKVHHPYCHKTMNRSFFETGRSFKLKDNGIQLRHPSLHASTVHKTNFPIHQHTDSSYRNTEGTKTMWKSAALSYKTNSKLQQMKDSAVRLGESHPAVANVSISTLSKGHIEGSHSKTTNPGYKRNQTGGFYAR